MFGPIHLVFYFKMKQIINQPKNKRRVGRKKNKKKQQQQPPDLSLQQRDTRNDDALRHASLNPPILTQNAPSA